MEDRPVEPARQHAAAPAPAAAAAAAVVAMMAAATAAAVSAFAHVARPRVDLSVPRGDTAPPHPPRPVQRPTFGGRAKTKCVTHTPTYGSY